MRTITRAVLAVAVVATIALAGSASARAASPEPDTLGAAVTRVVYLDDGLLAVRNMSTLETTFTFESSSWRVEPATLTLQPGEDGRVVVSGDGEDGSTVQVSMTTAGDTPDGTMKTALAFTSTVRHERPFDPWRTISSVGLSGVALIVGLTGLYMGIRRAKRYSFRVERRAAS